MRIKPAKSLNGKIILPGDKSISHRAILIASLAEGRSVITNFSTGEDCASTVRCMRQLGVEIEQDGTSVMVRGVGKAGLRKADGPLDCGNSGTTLRLLTGVLAGQNFDSILTGDESLRKRPMGRIIEPLTQMGAAITSDAGLAPLIITGRCPLKAIRYNTPVASAQVKSCILLAGLNAAGGTTVTEDTWTRDHTELMLKSFGADIDVFGKPDGGTSIKILGESILTGRDIEIPGDISSAAFFMVAAACLDGSTLEIENVGVNPTRSAILDKMIRFGADVPISSIKNTKFEPSADLTVNGRNELVRKTESNLISGVEIAGLIDEIPILAILGTQLDGGIEIRGARELRVKESDRITAIVENLRRMGGEIVEFDDGFKVSKSNLNGAVIDSHNDHRIAMAFAVAGLFASGETEINGTECVDISFPGFFETLASVVG
ncbi:MAG: 3-phosphoshikimate 1-carboxyvinyltransferase [Pyrinomonadaceae bacterium]